MRTKLRITDGDYAALNRHLFRKDRDEHAAIILAGRRNRPSGPVFLAREVHLLDESEFIPGRYGYRQVSPAALARLGNRAAEEGLALFSCHSHPGATSRNSLSRDDLEGHKRVFPHLLDIVDGSAVAGVAFGQESAAGEVWLRSSEQLELSEVEVIGVRLKSLAPTPRHADAALAQRFDRQARIFGAAGQEILREMSVSVIGAGGGGSMVIEQLAHLGVGSIAAVDFDVVKAHNLSRIVGATTRDADEGRKKVAVACDLVARIDPAINFKAIDGDLADADVATEVATTDFIFLCTDTITSRLVANAIVHTQLVPMVQIGAKVDVLGQGQIESIYVAIRPVFPGQGCLECAGLIDPVVLQQEQATDEERAAQNYLGLPEVIDPSVITLNGIAASTATNLMLMSAVGLAGDELLAHRLFDARHGTWLELKTPADPLCRWCGRHESSGFARGEAARLPVRLRSSEGTNTTPEASWLGRLAKRMRIRRQSLRLSTRSWSAGNWTRSPSTREQRRAPK